MVNLRALPETQLVRGRAVSRTHAVWLQELLTETQVLLKQAQRVSQSYGADR